MSNTYIIHTYIRYIYNYIVIAVMLYTKINIHVS